MYGVKELVSEPRPTPLPSLLLHKRWTQELPIQRERSGTMLMRDIYASRVSSSRRPGVKSTKSAVRAVRDVDMLAYGRDFRRE